MQNGRKLSQLLPLQSSLFSALCLPYSLSHLLNIEEMRGLIGSSCYEPTNVLVLGAPQCGKSSVVRALLGVESLDGVQTLGTTATCCFVINGVQIAVTEHSGALTLLTTAMCQHYQHAVVVLNMHDSKSLPLARTAVSTLKKTLARGPRPSVAVVATHSECVADYECTIEELEELCRVDPALIEPAPFFVDFVEQHERCEDTMRAIRERFCGSPVVHVGAN